MDFRGILLIVTTQICIILAQPAGLMYSPVCGTDGLTYPNPTAIESARESGNPDLSIAKQGPCYGNNIAGVCDCSLVYTPVCGSDRYTYPNVCHLKCMAGRTSMWNITLDHENECIRVPDDPNCNCAREWGPVCATNDVTYDSECLLDCASRGDPSIKLAYNFRCNPNLQFYIDNFKGVSWPQGSKL